MLFLSVLTSISGGSFCLSLKNNLRAAVLGRVPHLHGVKTAKTSLPKRAALREHLYEARCSHEGQPALLPDVYCQQLGLTEKKPNNQEPPKKTPNHCIDTKSTQKYMARLFKERICFTVPYQSHIFLHYLSTYQNRQFPNLLLKTSTVLGRLGLRKKFTFKLLLPIHTPL